MTWRVICGDALEVLRGMEAGSVDCCVTSPPYWGLRDYGVDGQLGLEPHPALYLEKLWAIMDEVFRVLKDTGTVWLNLGDTFGGSWGNYHPNSPPGKHGQRLKETARWNRPAYGDQAFLPPTANCPQGDNWLRPKQLLLIPSRFAIGCQERGWLLRSDVIWSKPNAMPSSVTDRFSCTYEHVFLFAKEPRYWFDLDSVREPMIYPERVYAPGDHKCADVDNRNMKGLHDGRESCGNPALGKNPGDTWRIPTAAFPEAHFAVFPPALPRRCIRAGCPVGGLVLDPFAGSGTTGKVAVEEGRRFVGIELSEEYCRMAERRIGAAQPCFPLA